MSALWRYVAAISHLGPRQTALNLLYRARQRTRLFGRYARPGRGLEWCGRSRAPLLAHAGGARLHAGTLEAIGRSDVVGDPPYWDADGPMLWRFNLHYFGWLHALPHAEQRRLVLDWIEHYRPSGGRPGWRPYPLSLRLRHWAQALFDGERPRRGAAARSGLGRGAGGCIQGTVPKKASETLALRGLSQTCG